MVKKEKLVSGPLNVLRLIGPNNQIVYLFIDRNVNIKYQLRCHKIKSRTLKDYLRDQLDLTDEEKLRFAVSVNESFFNKILDDVKTLQTSHFGSVMQMLIGRSPNHDKIEPIYLADTLNELIPPLNFQDPQKLDIFTLPENIKLLETEVQAFEILIKAVRGDFVTPKLISFLEHLDQIRDTPGYPLCLDLLISIRNNLIETINLSYDASELLANRGRDYFMDEIRENYTTNISQRLLFQYSRDLALLCHKIIVQWYDFNDLFSALCFAEELTDTKNPKYHDQTCIIYSFEKFANNILEILVKTKSFQITHIAHRNPEDMPINELNQHLRNLPIEEYNLLLLSLFDTEDLLPGKNDRPNQCVDLSSFPQGFT
jgi:hypothetical protein